MPRRILPWMLLATWLCRTAVAFAVLKSPTAATSDDNTNSPATSLARNLVSILSPPPQQQTLPPVVVDTATADAIPFIIDKVPDRPPSSDKIFQEIAEMCIQVFFNDQQGLVAPWKGLQLGYLQSVQMADLRERRMRGKKPNAMFVARRVLPMDDPSVSGTTPLILDTSEINNLDESHGDYVRGEVLGFCEVTERPFGLQGDNKNKNKSTATTRPILTNLSVKTQARQSGIGGALVEACEGAAARDFRCSEIVLEVENDNPAALSFYQKRGYSVVFEDKACRRYDTSGFLLSRQRCTKICMRKDLRSKRAAQDVESSVSDISKFFLNIKEKVLS